MRTTDWKDIAELVGIAAIVASLVFVGQQLRQDRAVAQADAWLQFVDTQVNFAQLISENADVWSRGLDGQSLSDPDQWTFNQIALAIDQKYASQFSRSNIGIRSGPAADVAVQYAELLFMYPGLRKFFEARVTQKIRKSTQARFDTAVSEYLVRLDSGEVEPSSSIGQAF